MHQTINRLKNSQKNNVQTLKDIEYVETVLIRSIELLALCKAQVGMVMGEDIEEFLASTKNQKFCSKQFNYERLPEGQ